MRHAGSTPKHAVRLFSVVSALAIAAAAHASVSTTFFQIDVDDGMNTASWSVDSSSSFVTYDGGTQTWNWTSAGQTIDLSGIVSVGSANLQAQQDPRRLSLGFALTAGANPVTVTITSTVLSFGMLATPDGVASVSMTLTDNNNNGATLSGVGGDAGSAYAAYYNAPGGTVFAEYLSSLTAPAGGTDTQGGYTGGLIPVGAPLSSMQVVMSFELSAGDQASATSNYVVVPEPTGAFLLSLGLVFAARRRR